MEKLHPSLKQSNKANILRILGDNGPTTRQDLARMMKLTPAAITKLTSELITEKFIKEVGINQGQKGKKGPKSINLDLTTSKLWAIGVHIKYRVIEIACVNFKGHVYDLEVIPFPGNINQIEFLNILKNSIYNYVDKNTDKMIIAIGIGSFGLVDNEKGKIQKVTHFPEWHNVPLQTVLESEITLPVMVTHHIQAITLAEKRYKNGSLGSDFLTVYLGEGIGTGMFINNELFPFGGQLAHINYMPDGRKCWCGQYGCIEQYVSEKVICRELGCQDVREIRNRVQENDSFVVNALHQYGEILGTAVTSFLHMIPMETVILYGELFFVESPLSEGLKKKIKKSMDYYEKNISIVEGSMDNNKIAVTGAASTVFVSKLLESYM